MYVLRKGGVRMSKKEKAHTWKGCEKPLGKRNNGQTNPKKKNGARDRMVRNKKERTNGQKGSMKGKKIKEPKHGEGGPMHSLLSQVQIEKKHLKERKDTQCQTKKKQKWVEKNKRKKEN